MSFTRLCSVWRTAHSKIHKHSSAVHCNCLTSACLCNKAVERLSDSAMTAAPHLTLLRKWRVEERLSSLSAVSSSLQPAAVLLPLPRIRREPWLQAGDTFDGRLCDPDSQVQELCASVQNDNTGKPPCNNVATDSNCYSRLLASSLAPLVVFVVVVEAAVAAAAAAAAAAAVG